MINGMQVPINASQVAAWLSGVFQNQKFDVCITLCQQQWESVESGLSMRLLHAYFATHMYALNLEAHVWPSHHSA